MMIMTYKEVWKTWW